MDNIKINDSASTGNIAKYCIRNAAYSCASLFISGAVIQTFLTYFGVSNAAVGIYISLLGAVNVAVSVAGGEVADNFRSVKKPLSILYTLISLVFVGMVIISLTGETGSTAFVFAAVLAWGIIQTALIAIRTDLEYKIPYQIIPPEYYGTLLSVSGVITGCVNVAAGLLLAAMIARFPYTYVMTAAFSAALVMMILAAIFNSALKEIRIYERPPASSLGLGKRFAKLIKMPEFNRLILPNLLRGIATGMIELTALIALTDGMTSEDTAYIITIASFAAIAGSALYTGMTGRLQNRTICIIGCSLYAFLPLLCCGNKTVFFIACFFIYLGKMINDYIIPQMVFKIVGFDTAGSYNALRMALTTSGSALASYVFGGLLGKIPILPLLIFGMLCQSVSGFIYLRVCRK